ncbi:MAG TPA: hypothetical protein QGF58_16425 [Myxococcota bacterium]|nr:hypothetical protein [Myxococcota bacterium]
MLLLALLCGCGSAIGQDEGVPLAEAASWPEGDTRGMQELVDRLETRERALDRREASAEAREAELREVETRIEERLVELETLRSEIETLLDDGDEVRKARVRALIKMVESMRASDAGTFVAELEEDLAVEVLDGMNTSKAGKVLASMEPDKAASLAERLTLPTLQR